ncbi:MAG: hypothetical protein IH605_00570 [Burkholderiales bacterium]|nr:hypothetical protein [Burkholderiales bacterium]
MKLINTIGVFFIAFVCGVPNVYGGDAPSKIVTAQGSPRTIQVTNNTGSDIWVGITTAAVSCATTPAGGSDLLCPTQAKGSCGNGGITCMGGLNKANSGWCGKYPWSSSTGYCYQMMPTVSNPGEKSNPASLHLATGKSLTLTTPTTVPNNIPFAWSGNLFARTGCSSGSDSSKCQMGDCGAATASNKWDSGAMCPPGAGGNPQGTLGELTLANPGYIPPKGAASLGPDYYDVSIINGVDFAAIVGPINGKTNTAAPYLCTAAGSTAAQGKLSACSWSIKPVFNKIDYSSSLRNVALPAPSPQAAKQGRVSSPGLCPGINGGAPRKPNAAGYCQCPGSTSSKLIYPNADGYCPSTGKSKEYPDKNGHFKTCSGNTKYPNSYGYCECTVSSQCGASQACGVALNASANLYTQTCGTFIGWTTADTLCGNYKGANIPPFLQALCTPKGAPISVTNYLGCTGSASAATSCYNNATTTGRYQKTCCGCGTSTASQKAYPGVWPTVNTGSGDAKNGGCYGNSPDWNKYVQPALVYLKQACPTAYVYPFDDATSTFTCNATTAGAGNWPNYQVSFQPLSTTP